MNITNKDLQEFDVIIEEIKQKQNLREDEKILIARYEKKKEMYSKNPSLQARFERLQQSK